MSTPRFRQSDTCSLLAGLIPAATLVLTPSSVQASAECAWVYLQHPMASAASCERVSFPPATRDQPFTIIDTAHGQPLSSALDERLAFARGTAPSAPGALERDLEITPEFRRWGLRNVAFHLGRMHELLRNRLGRRFPSRRLTVHLTPNAAAWGFLDRRIIELGGRAEINSEVIYHEYAHHVIEWERPGLMANRDRFRDSDQYAMIEVWANHLAFAIDGEPRFSEYPASVSGFLKSAYSVETDCTLGSCDQWVFRAGHRFPEVITFGAVLWDLHRASGRDESITLVLDSLAHLDLQRKLTLADGVNALLRADSARGGRYRERIIESAERRLNLDF